MFASKWSNVCYFLLLVCIILYIGASNRKVRPLTERVGLSQIGWASHREVGPLTLRHRSLTERPRPFEILLALKY